MKCEIWDRGYHKNGEKVKELLIKLDKDYIDELFKAGLCDKVKVIIQFDNKIEVLEIKKVG